MSKGYVYVLSNPSMPGLVKIGRSIHGGRQRANQLFQTGIPTPFHLEFEILVDDHDDIESLVHENLWQYREDERREFFRIPASDAVLAVLKAVAATFDHGIDHVDLTDSLIDVRCVAHKLGVPDPDIARAVSCISEFAWRDALKQHKLLQAERIARSKWRGFE